MLTNALLVLTVTAVGGLLLAAKILMGKQAPWSVSLIHALLGAAGLVMLIIIVMDGTGGGRVTAALGILVVAALGGFYLASLHLKGKLAPKGIVVVHAGVAVVGFLTLASVVLGL